MRYQITDQVKLLNLHDMLVVEKTIHYSHDDGRPYYRNEKAGSVILFGEELIAFTSSQSGSKIDHCYDLNDCNKLLILLDCFLSNAMKAPVMFEIQGFLAVRGESKQKKTVNLLITMGSNELYLTPFEARCAAKCIKNVLISLARD